MIALALVASALCAEPDPGALEPAPEPWAREVDERGAPQSEGLTLDGLLEGPWSAWHETGYLSDVGQYRHGREVGLWRSWDEEGRLVAEGEWQNGQPEGTWRYFHPSGAVASEGSYVDGLRAGPWAERFEDGTLFRVTAWEYGEAARSEAEASCLDLGLEWRVDLGARTEGCLDEEGRRTGLWRGFHPSGAVAWERTWSAGLLDEEGFDYHPSGALLHAGAYRVGGPDGVHVWTDAAGSVLGVTVLEEGTGPWRDLWPDGAVKEEGAWVAFGRDGLWRAWDERGAEVAEVVWERGERVSARLVAGGLVLEGGYADGLRDGPWTARDGDGKRVWAGRYQAGLRSGLWLIARVDARGAAGADALELTFEGDQEIARTAWWPDGRVREVATPDARACWWPRALMREDRFIEGQRVVDPDEDPATTWLRAGELQAWLLADPAPGALIETTVAPDDEREVARGRLAARVREPEPRDAPPAVGETSESGEPEGLWTYFYEDGARSEQGSFVAGKREGLWRGWDRDEHLAWEGRFAEDVLDGHWRSFHRDGSLAIEGDLRRGVRVGTWMWYHPRGGPSVVGDYEGGQPNGGWRGFHPNGLVAWTGAYAVGRRVGTWVFWRPDGTRWREAVYGDEGRERP